MKQLTLAPAPTLAARLRACLVLTKPTIVLLVVITGLPALLLSGGRDPWRMLAALAGIALAAAGAAVLNHWYDRDLDARMARTMARPLPAGLLPPAQALALGLGLSLMSLVWLAATTTGLATLLAALAIVHYAGLYTVGLKRRTAQNIVIGGAAGASAPLIAWAAMTGTLAPAPWVMALVVFLWTPPHFWALALYRQEEYGQAGLPMLPVVAGPEVTRRQIVGYTVATVLASLALAGLGAGPWYAGAAVVLGARFLERALVLYRRRSDQAARSLFGTSILYLLLLFAALTLDLSLGRLGAGP